ncbi:hypothetical protein RBH94_06000 [Aestuariibaculum sp. YM273]|uniref:hypothetical protein n=1 Tax=Aestuariibaculum sp. YM273 TaxID=3070659 RepID=UPI0027DB8236|nr:hypothetical protein [Aestuariibaculum sp. YM273]WMI66713.1 hypothetical protein RBH94_06000 [Aestuariibaculum sp. YM273]
MEKEFIESNIVILGDLKPSFYDKLFFVKNNLISEDSFLDSTIITPSLVRIITNDIAINIETTKIVIVNKTRKQNDFIKDITLKIITQSSFDFEAIGFNYKWFIFLPDIHEHTKTRFWNSSNTKLNSHFDSDNSAYGYYVSRDFLDARMKLDIKPGVLKEVDSNNSKLILNLDYNLHFEKEYIMKSIESYDVYSSKVSEITKDYE